MAAQVVCIAMLNADSGKGQVLFQSDDFESVIDVNKMIRDSLA